MKAVVVTSGRISGGGDRVMLAMVRCLLRKGYEVTLASLSKMDTFAFRRWFGDALHVKTVNFTPFGPALKVPTLLYAPLLIKWFEKLRASFDISINPFAERIPLACDILYINGARMYHREWIRWMSLFYGRDYSWLASRAALAYYTIYGRYFNRATNSYRRAPSVVCNSRYDQPIVEQQVRRAVGVLYPPVDVELFDYPPTRPKSSLVLTVARFSPEKNLERVPEIARLCPKMKFVIAGIVITEQTVSTLKRAIKSSGLTNVELDMNVPLDRVRELYSRAEFYLQTAGGEPFGIAIVEGMAASAIPLVPKSGGPWLDIIDRGMYGFGYSDYAEAADIINSLAEKKQTRWSTIAYERARYFSLDRFEQRFNRIVGSII